MRLCADFIDGKTAAHTLKFMKLLSDDKIFEWSKQLHNVFHKAFTMRVYDNKKCFLIVKLLPI